MHGFATRKHTSYVFVLSINQREKRVFLQVIVQQPAASSQQPAAPVYGTRDKKKFPTGQGFKARWQKSFTFCPLAFAIMKWFDDSALFVVIICETFNASFL